MTREEWLQGNRLPWRALVGALGMGILALTASGITPVDASKAAGDGIHRARVVSSLSPAAERLAKRFGVRRDLAAVIYEQARLVGVKPAMAFGVIATESGFDPAAVGRHGERGLMQIKPSTARAYDARITPDGLHDPEVNVRLGLRHLKREVEYFGDPVLGLMSYHMGRARLQRELADGVPPRDRYVERVLSRCGPDCA